MKPNKKRIKKWVKALKSGKYSQTRKRLRDDTGYCCLGVACDVCKKGKWEGDEYYIGGWSYDENIPNGVKKWYGIDGEPFVEVKGKKRYLVDLNDDYKWSFKKIAKAIEKKYLKEGKNEEE